MKIYNKSYTVGKPFGAFTVVNRGTNNEYRIGTYTFNYGVVTIYAEPKFATFSFVYYGIIYSMNISDLKQPLTDRQLIVRAGKFARLHCPTK